MLSTREKVKNAALMMDKEIPGWAELVDPTILQMQSCSACVLGQVFGFKMEAKLKTILGSSFPKTSLRDKTDNVPQFSRGLEFMKSHGYSSEKYPHTKVGNFAANETNCAWAEEVVDRRLNKEQLCEKGSTEDVTS